MPRERGRKVIASNRKARHDYLIDDVYEAGIVLMGTLVFGVLEAVFAVSRIYPLSLVLIAGVGFAETAFAQLSIITLQTVAPDHLRGRVMSVTLLFFDGSVPLGYMLMGWLSGLYGASIALLIGALLSLMVAGAGWIWRKPAEKDFSTFGTT